MSPQLKYQSKTLLLKFPHQSFYHHEDAYILQINHHFLNNVFPPFLSISKVLRWFLSVICPPSCRAPPFVQLFNHRVLTYNIHILFFFYRHLGQSWQKPNSDNFRYGQLLRLTIEYFVCFTGYNFPSKTKSIFLQWKEELFFCVALYQSTRSLCSEIHYSIAHVMFHVLYDRLLPFLLHNSAT